MQLKLFFVFVPLLLGNGCGVKVEEGPREETLLTPLEDSEDEDSNTPRIPLASRFDPDNLLIDSMNLCNQPAGCAGLVRTWRGTGVAEVSTIRDPLDLGQAWKLETNPVTGGNYLLDTVTDSNDGTDTDFLPGEDYVLSAYLKKGSTNKVHIFLWELPSTAASPRTMVEIDFDGPDGGTTYLVSKRGSGSHDVEMESLGDGWYRVAFSITYSVNGTDLKADLRSGPNGIGDFTYWALPMLEKRFVEN